MIAQLTFAESPHDSVFCRIRKTSWSFTHEHNIMLYHADTLITVLTLMPQAASTWQVQLVGKKRCFSRRRDASAIGHTSTGGRCVRTPSPDSCLHTLTRAPQKVVACAGGEAHAVRYNPDYSRFPAFAMAKCGQACRSIVPFTHDCTSCYWHCKQPPCTHLLN